ncbi:hypothetical protein [Streptacidiphilus anmyonensis]|uniref:hypothetical protein n=1 Tax=Streptacidiphilus anmyonensis TaxID=405782 RepID=UPI00128B475F|nr:hypothetical protein [Streptacidiphilus anmyonensis]
MARPYAGRTQARRTQADRPYAGRSGRWLALGALATATALAFSGTAWAGGVLPSGSAVSSTVAQGYDYPTSYDYWSVAAVQPSSGANYGLTMLNAGGGSVGASNVGANRTNFVAVDSNVGTNPLGTWYPQVVQHTAGSYWVEAQYGAKITTIPTPTHHGTTGAGDPDIAFSVLNGSQVAVVSDIYLTAGESFWASTPTAAQSLYLLEATPGQASTYAQGRSTAAATQSTKVVDNCTLYTAKQTGWHALVLVGDAPLTGNSQAGIAIGVHQYDPSQPGYCPMADFPGPTP